MKILIDPAYRMNSIAQKKHTAMHSLSTRKRYDVSEKKHSNHPLHLSKCKKSLKPRETHSESLNPALNPRK